MGGFLTRKAPPSFQPVIMFQPETEADKLAVKMVYSLQADIHETMDTERNRKTTIGISEIGNPCDKCVARQLSELYVLPSDTSWKAQIGTFMHAGLEDHFGAKYGNAASPLWATDHDVTPVATDLMPLYHLERRVQILQHKGLDLNGSCDLFIQGASFGIVDDWKSQNQKKLLSSTAKGDIGPTYTVQMHTYGLGYELLGYLVTHVLLYALPRDGELNDAKPVLMRYDRSIALRALARLTSMIDAAEILEQGFPGEGWERFIRAQDRANGCWDCGAYENAEQDNFLRDLTS